MQTRGRYRGRSGQRRPVGTARARAPSTFRDPGPLSRGAVTDLSLDTVSTTTSSDPLQRLAAGTGLPAAQQPAWPDRAVLDGVVSTLASYPPLVFAGECDVLRDRMANARLAGSMQTTTDFSYFNRRLVGPRLLRVGDAAGFMDPIFSAGVHLALWSGKLASEVVHAGLANERTCHRLARRYERIRHPFLARTARTADPVNIALRVLRQVEVNDMRYAGDIETACRNVRCNKDIDAAVAELAHDVVPLILRQVAVQAVRRISALLKRFAKLVDTPLRTAEDNCQLRRFHVEQPA